jgi:hypothetical protein
MYDERKLKWPPILLFTVSGIAFGLSLYMMVVGTVKSDARAHGVPDQVASAAGAEPHPDEARVRVVLHRGAKYNFGQVDVIYRGVEDEHVRLDVFIRDLDPHYPYRREIAYRKAQEGFRLGGVQFELISAGRTKAKLIWLRKG